MSFQIYISDEAQTNIAEASEYYLELSSALQQKYFSDLISTIDYLKENPRYFQVRYREVRIAHLKTFPFSIHFIVEYQNVYVLTVLHQKQLYS